MVAVQLYFYQIVQWRPCQPSTPYFGHEFINRLSYNKKERWRSKHFSHAYRVYVIALIEVEPPLHTDTLNALQPAKHQPTSMALH